jgi:signal peptide peptidase SppA
MENKTLLPVLQRICNQPLLVSKPFESALAGAIMPPWRKSLTMALNEIPASMRSTQFVNQNGVAVIQVYGYLSYRYDWMMDLIFGNTSYESIRSQFQEALVDPTIKAIAFDINSPGGEVAGAFDLVDEIYQARGSKPIYTVFNEDGFSAAYAIASAADKRYIARTGSAGSVGVVMMHVDQSGWDEKIGVKYTPIYAGARKVDYSSHAPLSEEARASAQADVDSVYDIFVNTVARNLGTSAAFIRATEAGIYQGKKAVEVGFADQVMSWNQFMTKLTNRKYGGIMKAELEKLWKEMTARFNALIGSTPETAQDSVSKADAEALVAAAEKSAKAEGVEEGRQAGMQEGVKEGKKQFRERCEAIREICTLASMDKDAIGYIMDESLDVEAVRAKVVETQAMEAERTRIRSTVGPLSTGAVNPLIEGAKKAAADAARK